MKQDRSLRVLAIVAICISVVGLMVGYASLSTTLTLNSTTTLPLQTWNIVWDNLATTPSTGVTASASLDTNKLAITATATLKQPGDTVTYTFDAVNKGTLDAILTNDDELGITLDSKVAPYVTATLTNGNGSAIGQNTLLATGTDAEKTNSYKLVITYKEDVETLPSEELVVEINKEFLYEQYIH